MELELVGRHALLFDDDVMAAFVNSDDALVGWHSLQIDRYDVRHLLSAPPPPISRNRNSEPIIPEDPLLESQLDHERYLDLPMLSEVDGDENPVDEGGYRAVAFSYGENDDLANQNKKDTEMEVSGFIPPFPIPGNLLQSLPSTEKVHQIIARTAMFVRKHGGQSEIILRVKQGDNPTFGFLMPDNHLHSYFRFLVEHPELLHSDGDGKPKGELKMDNKHLNTNVGEALSLLGSAYDSGEEEDGNDDAKGEKLFSHDGDRAMTINHSFSHVSKIENTSIVNDMSLPKNKTSSNKEKALSLKNNSTIPASKTGGAKGIKKEIKSGSLPAASEKGKNATLEINSKNEPVILEPPPEFRSLIDKIVEFVIRNGKQFEETLIEQDTKHGRFPFLHPSNQYHPYYWKVLQTAQESKANGKSSYSGKEDLVGLGIDKKALTSKKREIPSSGSYISDIPLESHMKEKFKMVIGKSKKETQDTQSQGAQPESVITVDAAAAAAILQSAIRGGSKSIPRNTTLNGHAGCNDANKPTSLGSLMPLHRQSADRRGSSRTSHEAACGVDHSDSHLTEEQKVKAERLKRAKLFVATLRSGEVPAKSEKVPGLSVSHLGSGVSKSASEVSIAQKEREGSFVPPHAGMHATVEKPERICFGEEHSERLARRKYRSRPGGCEDDAEDNSGDKETHKHRSSSGRHSEGYKKEDTEGIEQKSYRKRHHSHSSSEENANEGDRDEDMEPELSKLKYPSQHSCREDEKHDCEDKELKDHKRSRKKHRSHYSSRKKRHSSKKCSDEEYEHDGDDGSDRKNSSKKHRSGRTSERSKKKHRRGNKHSSKVKESQRESSSDTLHQPDDISNKRRKGLHIERDELEEGEISSRVSEESKGIVSDRVSRETSIDALSSNRKEASENVAEVPDDLRAKIRAMLLATRL